MRARPTFELLLVFLSFLAVAIAQSWPLALHLDTHLTADVGGDAGVYVWNTWVFRRELLAGANPFATTSVLPLAGPTDLSLHNYTVFANLLALPLQSWLSPVASFNVVYLINVALAGLGAFVLARQLLPRDSGARNQIAWIAGLLFCCSPFLVARSTAHFSLVAAAPLPFFVVCFDRAWQQRRPAMAAAAGACMAWAAYCDAYYAVYCLMLGVLIVTWRSVSVTFPPRRGAGPTRVVDALIGLLILLIGARFVLGDRLTLPGVTLSMRTLYTPVLVLTSLLLLRAWLLVRPHFKLDLREVGRRAIVIGVLGATAAALLTPILVALADRAGRGDMVTPPVLWRSSAPGVDLAALVAPNPNHPLAPDGLVRWHARQPGQYEENVASLPLAALAVLTAAWWLARHAPDRFWLTILLLFGSLSLGPFVRVADVLTYVPTPWAVLRYVPVISQARMPARFSVLVVMALAVLVAAALAALVRQYPDRRRWILVGTAVLLAFELLPAPRRLRAADVPAVFDTVAHDRRDGRVLNIPFGIRDGLSSFGNFSAASLFFQTSHGKPIVGGYLSRVSPQAIDLYLDDPVLALLIGASEGEPATADGSAAAVVARDEFFRRTGTRWVVVDQGRASPTLQALVVEVLDLERRERSGAFVLYERRRAEPSGQDAAYGAADAAERTGE